MALFPSISRLNCSLCVCCYPQNERFIWMMMLLKFIWLFHGGLPSKLNIRFEDSGLSIRELSGVELACKAHTTFFTM